MISVETFNSVSGIHFWPTRTKDFRRHRACLTGLVLLFLAAFVSSARANVYATNIKLNGTLTDSWVAPGYPARISYILNEPATMGVTLQIFSGTNVVRTFLATNGQAGALVGSNAFIWDGTSDNGSNIAEGAYSLRITAGAVGYGDWTNFMDVYQDNPRSIDVNKNTASPYYGRVFIGNNDGNQPADVYKYNSDGSAADEGLLGTDGYGWVNNSVAPNDSVYVNDWQGAGFVLDFDQEIDANWSISLWSDNYPFYGVSLGGMYVSQGATNGQLWMADVGLKNVPQNGIGIVRWDLLADGTVGSNDIGTTVVSTTNSDLTLAPYDVAVTTNGFIYTIQRIADGDQLSAMADTTNKLLCFPPWTNGAPPETAALWAVGAGDTNLVNASGVDVDPTGSWVAVGSRGFGSDPESLTNGTVSVYNAKNGQLVTRFYTGQYREIFDVAWDRAGNLYAADFGSNAWHVFSPPGTNQATTVCVSSLEVLSSLQPPELMDMTVTTNGTSFVIDGQSAVSYAVELSTNCMDWTDIGTNFDSAPERLVNLPPTTDAQDYYRVKALPAN